MIAASTSADRAAAPAPQWLATVGELVRPALQRTIGELHPDLARMAAYHKGWADADGHPTTGQAQGKGVRAALAVWSAQATGADRATGLLAAVAVELVHDFSLLHDDIMDNDRTRRGRPTAWVVYGAGPAILLGDALYAMAHKTLLAAPHGARGAARLAHAVHELCRGQATDLQYEQRQQVSVAEYLAMVESKTCALMQCAAVLGAILAAAPSALVAELDRLGHHMGVLFQIVDDLLGVFGDPAVTGKSARSDLARRKKTLPIVAALASPSTAGQELTELLNGATLSDADLDRAAALVAQAGGRARAQAECARHHRQAHNILHRLDLPADSKAMVHELLTFLIDRSN